MEYYFVAVKGVPQNDTFLRTFLWEHIGSGIPEPILVNSSPPTRQFFLGSALAVNLSGLQPPK